MELLIALLFFAIAEAVCLSLFVGAHNTNNNSRHLGHASVLLSNYSEWFYSCDPDDINSEITYYDDTLKQCDISFASYCISSDISKDNDFIRSSVLISDPQKEKTYLEMEIKRYERRSKADVSKD